MALLFILPAVHRDLVVTLAVSEQDVAALLHQKMKLRNLVRLYLLEKLLLHVGHSYGRSLVSGTSSANCMDASNNQTWHTRSFVALEMLEFGECAIAHAALLQRHSLALSRLCERSFD